MNKLSSSPPGFDHGNQCKMALAAINYPIGNVERKQCDQIGRFIGLWVTFQSLRPHNLPKSPSFLGKICNFSSEIIFGQLLWTFGDFLPVTLSAS